MNQLHMVYKTASRPIISLITWISNSSMSWDHMVCKTAAGKSTSFLNLVHMAGLLVVPKIGIWFRIRSSPKKRSDLSQFSEHWWNSDLFTPLNFENWSSGSKVMHFCSIFSFKMLKARKCSEFVPNFVSFGAF